MPVQRLPDGIEVPPFRVPLVVNVYGELRSVLGVVDVVMSGDGARAGSVKNVASAP